MNTETTTPQAPKQQRSRKTLDALLHATIRTLDSDGLEACTLPRVAAAAGVSSASVYRRFADKDGLLQAAFLHVLEQSNQTNAKAMEQALLRPTLEETAERLVIALVQQYRAHPRLLRALSQFLEAHAGSEFAQKAQGIMAKNLKMASDVLLKHKERIRHPNAPRAVMFAALQAASSIEAVVLETESLWKTALPLTDKQLVAEVTRAMLGYLRRKA